MVQETPNPNSGVYYWGEIMNQNRVLRLGYLGTEALAAIPFSISLLQEMKKNVRRCRSYCLGDKAAIRQRILTPSNCLTESQSGLKHVLASIGVVIVSSLLCQPGFYGLERTWTLPATRFG